MNLCNLREVKPKIVPLPAQLRTVYRRGRNLSRPPDGLEVGIQILSGSNREIVLGWVSSITEKPWADAPDSLSVWLRLSYRLRHLSVRLSVI